MNLSVTCLALYWAPGWGGEHTSASQGVLSVVGKLDVELEASASIDSHWGWAGKDNFKVP